MSSIAVCQITATTDKEQNFEVCSKLIREASERKAKAVFLPEACDYMGRNVKEILSMAEPLDGPIATRYKNLAKDLQIWISLGGIHEKTSSEKVSNSHIIINDKGEIAAVYRKVHLFDVEIPERNLNLKESKYVQKGYQIGPPVNSPVGKIGLGICYDLRFPAFSQRLMKMGSQIITYPSAFTTTTGPDHWEILLRSRAIENQCFVVAAAQVGKHFEGRSSYGHGMIVDPWGKVLAEFTDDNEGVILADLDLKKLANIRRNMPVADHQREDLYYLKRNVISSINDQPTYKFGEVTLKNSVLFYKTSLTMAFVNKRNVLPGPKRLSDLTAEENEDFFDVVRIVQRGMEEVHQASSSTIAIQDGPDAGQTIQHVHAHIIPRKKNDLKENDEIYARLQNHEQDTSVRIRNEDEMEAEATQLRQHFKD
ncbi:hypothetical protein J437_LFUL009265 [Ladona fulva]|uniref:Nitrilase and fragile histidine triad fusion protein NitFhit n=1 Tax=Ladona fulva TaxID=123851 RepID=A0A8K0K9T4_LADFU|nr:hypothetical protein J437_LFUL009265 [Ladona fulva]